MFGYEIIRGKNVINTKQAEVINKAMTDYIEGASLQRKADELTTKKIEYAPGKYHWNKNRVQRMLTNPVYLGTESYPRIVKQELSDEVKTVMDSRNTQKKVKREEIFSSAIVPICCGLCGSLTERIYEGRTKVVRVHHKCTNPECKKSYTIYDIDFRKMVRDLLATAEELSIVPSKEVGHEIQSLKYQIQREIESSDVSLESVKNKIFRCAALQYSQYTKPKESIDYSKMGLCSLEFNREIKRRVKCVCIDTNEKIWLCLSDGQIVGKDVFNNE